MTPSLMWWMTSVLLAVTSLCVLTCHGLELSLQRSHRSADTHRGTNPQRTLSRRTRGQHQPASLKDRVRYGILMDAGSSSTKIKVYTYMPAVPPSLVPRVQLEISERVRPGLASFVSKSLSAVEEYVVEMLSHAVDKVPAHLHASTPVYVMATAGMRILSPTEAKHLLRHVADVLQNSTINPFLFVPDYVSILSGEEEAVYAWLAVNYLRGFFSSDRSHPDSVGVLEMGGGSMQVAFLPDTPLYQEEFQVYVGRHRFDLYAQTYLSFGSNYLTGQVRQRLLSQQLQQMGDHAGMAGKRLYSPCMLSDDSDKYQWGDKSVKVMGTGNATHCEEILSKLLEPSEDVLCSPQPCAIGDRYQPAVGNRRFFAISAFLYAPKTLDAVEADGVMNITKLRQTARKYCASTVAEAVSMTGTKPEFASNDCLMGLYIPLLMTTALGFDQHTDQVIVTKDINGTRIDWALGAMVQLLSMTFMDDLDSVVSCRHGDEPLPVPVTDFSPSGSGPLTPTLTLASLLVMVLGSVRVIRQ